MNRPMEFGITGGIGSGKSLVCRIFQCLGIPIYNSDSRAKELMISEEILVEQIKKEFGAVAYQPDGSLDRRYLGNLAFKNPKKLQKLNALVHPRVAADYRLWLTAHEESKYLIREAALLFEAGLDTSMAKMVVVCAPEDLRIRRVLVRDPHRNEEEIRRIMKNQWPDEEKIKKADYLVYNNDQQLVIPQVLRLHDTFLLLADNKTR